MLLNEVSVYLRVILRALTEKVHKKSLHSQDSLVSETDRNQEIRKVLLNIGPWHHSLNSIVRLLNYQKVSLLIYLAVNIFVIIYRIWQSFCQLTQH